MNTKPKDASIERGKKVANKSMALVAFCPKADVSIEQIKKAAGKGVACDGENIHPLSAVITPQVKDTPSFKRRIAQCSIYLYDI